ncbi:hypothetical protein GCM10012288_06300 [Malaciobacter pacificus]|uniref:DUF86 domain-containing protein n=1 Tax=Malaciobacter pacificus TaxID=1080223 RepID=A0A5C2HC41_9BACT|nr:HepT-like ribonuclease domain-containing protein [Malaciobacter pacificus]QEP33842.1 DUF86 domain-containing protein [Malaciobacter pacificus]GGD35059.1 hypothetical protein GCM10012288_06300 [Malaciobacter pacificus]
MSKRKIEFYILDILIAIDKVERYTKKFSNGTELLNDELSWDATIRELEIIGEATKILLNESFLEDKKYRRIVDFRNQINHGYFGIDEDIVWDVIKNKLVEFKTDIDELIYLKNIDIILTIEIFEKENLKQKSVIKFLQQLKNLNSK